MFWQSIRVFPVYFFLASRELSKPCLSTILKNWPTCLGLISSICCSTSTLTEVPLTAMPSLRLHLKRWIRVFGPAPAEAYRRRFGHHTSNFRMSSGLFCAMLDAEDGTRWVPTLHLSCNSVTKRKVRIHAPCWIVLLPIWQRSTRSGCVFHAKRTHRAQWGGVEVVFTPGVSSLSI